MRNFLFLIFLIFLTSKSFAGVWYYGSGEAVDLENNIGFVKHNIKIITNESNDPSVIGYSATAGSVILSASGSLFIKEDDLANTNWGKAITSTSTLGELGDVETTSTATNDILAWNGSNWFNTSTASLTFFNVTGTASVGGTLIVDNNPISFSPTGGLSGSNDKEILEFNGTAWTNTPATYVSEVLGTRITDGASLSINGGDAATLDISSAIGYVVNNYTDPENPTITKVIFTGTTGMTLDNLATEDTTFILIDSSGTILQQPTLPTSEQVRDYLFVGTVIHPNNVTISSVNDNNGQPPIDMTPALYDLSVALGPINIAGGNAFGASGANLKIDKTNGKVFQFGSNYKSNKKDPNHVTLPPCTECVFFYAWRDGTGTFVAGAATTDIVPGLYDDGLGTPTDPNGAVLNNQWTIQRVFINLAGAILIQYGQEVYLSSDLAKNAVNSEDWERSPLAQTLLYIGNIIIRGGTGNLTTDGIFLQVVTAGNSSTSIEQNNWAIVDIDDATNPNNIAGCNVVYAVNATSGAVTATLPDSSTANDGCQNSFILDVNTNTLTLETSGGIQLIGNATSQLVSQTGKGITVISHGSDTKYLIRQDSRFLEGTTNNAIQVWDDTALAWIERSTLTVTSTSATINGDARITSNATVSGNLTVGATVYLTQTPTTVGTKSLVLSIDNGTLVLTPNASVTSQIAYIKDHKAANTSGGNFNSGDWRDRDLNTVTGATSIISLSPNNIQFALQAGTYDISAHVPGYRVGSMRAKLYNASDEADTTLISDSIYLQTGATSGDGLSSYLEGRITITSSKTFSIQHRCSDTYSVGFGIASNFGIDEVYTQVRIEKVE